MIYNKIEANFYDSAAHGKNPGGESIGSYKVRGYSPRNQLFQ